MKDNIPTSRNEDPENVVLNETYDTKDAEQDSFIGINAPPKKKPNTVQIPQDPIKPTFANKCLARFNPRMLFKWALPFHILLAIFIFYSISRNSREQYNVIQDERDLTCLYETAKHHQAVHKRCSQIDQRLTMLSKLGVSDHAYCRHISEELSTWWMVLAIYTADQEQTHLLYDLHRNFRDYAHSIGINTQTIEVIFPGQDFQLTKPNNEPADLQYKSDWIFAMRENLVNVGAKHLPDDWEYISWMDQHILWKDPDWFEKAIWLMSHYNIVQLINGNEFWDVNNKTTGHIWGFGKIYDQYKDDFESVSRRQCGVAWGTRREIFEEVGGLLDVCIGTKCDLYQNYAYVGMTYTHETINDDYKNMVESWQKNAAEIYKKKMGFLDVEVAHFAHCVGKCKTSNYDLQTHAMIEYEYSPNKDLTRDDEGRLSLTGNLPLAKRLWEIYGGPPRKN